MGDILLVMAIVGLALGFLAAMISLRERRHSKRELWAVIGTVVFSVGAASFVAWIFLLPRVPAALKAVALAAALIGLLLWTVTLFAGRRLRHGGSALRQNLAFAGRVALPGWQGLDTSTMRAEDRQEATRIKRVVNVGAAVVVFPVIAAVMAASIVMNIRGSQTSDFLSHAIGYYTLLIASCWTVSYLLTIASVAIFQMVRGNGQGLALSKVAVSVGTWAGLGAAGSVFVGTLIPLVVVPLSRGEFRPLGLSLLDSISPSLLLEISTAGAVYGFMLGEVVSTINISTREANLYVKSALPPLLFASLASVLSVLGLSPGQLSTVLSRQYSKTVSFDSAKDPFATALSEGLDSDKGWAALVAGFDQHGWNQIVDHHVFLVMTWVIALLVAAFSLIINIRRREVALMTMVPQDGPASVDGGPKDTEQM